METDVDTFNNSGDEQATKKDKIGTCDADYTI